MELFNKFVLSIALLRFLSGSIEILAAIIILKFNDITKALIVNSSLALVGPIILILTTSIGLIGISYNLSFTKIAWILTGVFFILVGVKS